MLRRATPDGQVSMKKSDKIWSTGEGNGTPLQDSCMENPMDSAKRDILYTHSDHLTPTLRGCAIRFQTYKAKLVQKECQLHLPNKAEDGGHT